MAIDSEAGRRFPKRAAIYTKRRSVNGDRF
jgi:hypothetical protein